MKIENPAYRISLKKAKELGLYKGRIPKEPYEKVPVKAQIKKRIKPTSYLKKVPGKKRRKRVFVKGYTRVLTYLFQIPRPKIKKEVKPKKIVLKKWISVWDYMERLKKEYEEPEIDLVFRKNLRKDVISLYDGFVWDKPLPYKGEVSPGHPHYVFSPPRLLHRKTLFSSARVWYLLYHVEKEIFFVWCRSARFRYVVNSYVEAVSEVRKIQEAVRDYYDKPEFDDYLELQGFLAFTLYYAHEKMPMNEIQKKKKRRKK